MARNESTVWTMTLPGGTSTTAASSGSCRPISTSLRGTGFSALSARVKTVAPTFAPHPPHRMAMAEISLITSLLARPAGRSVFSSSSMSGKLLNLSMKRRSIQFFQRHIALPLRDQMPREATAYWSPVEIRLRNRRCGVKRRSER